MFAPVVTQMLVVELILTYAKKWEATKLIAETRNKNPSQIKLFGVCVYLQSCNYKS